MLNHLFVCLRHANELGQSDASQVNRSNIHIFEKFVDEILGQKTIFKLKSILKENHSNKKVIFFIKQANKLYMLGNENKLTQLNKITTSSKKIFQKCNSNSNLGLSKVSNYINGSRSKSKKLIQSYSSMNYSINMISENEQIWRLTQKHLNQNTPQDENFGVISKELNLLTKFTAAKLHESNTKNQKHFCISLLSRKHKDNKRKGYLKKMVGKNSEANIESSKLSLDCISLNTEEDTFLTPEPALTHLPKNSK